MRKPSNQKIAIPLEAAKVLASGTVRFAKTYDSQEWIRACCKRQNRAQERARTTPEMELEIWSSFERLSQEIGPKGKFNKDGMCNHWERMRRNALFGLFNLVDFRSQDERIREVFQRNFGRVSLKWMIECCKTDAPTWYYKWAFDAIPGIMSKVWGPTAMALIVKSDEHRDLFRELEPIKENLLVVKRVMES